MYVDTTLNFEDVDNDRAILSVRASSPPSAYVLMQNHSKVEGGTVTIYSTPPCIARTLRTASLDNLTYPTNDAPSEHSLKVMIIHLRRSVLPSSLVYRNTTLPPCVEWQWNTFRQCAASDHTALTKLHVSAAARGPERHVRSARTVSLRR